MENSLVWICLTPQLWNYLELAKSIIDKIMLGSKLIYVSKKGTQVALLASVLLNTTDIRRNQNEFDLNISRVKYKYANT